MRATATSRRRAESSDSGKTLHSYSQALSANIARLLSNATTRLTRPNRDLSRPLAPFCALWRTADHGRQNPDRVGESRVAPSAVSAHPRRPANHRAGADRSNGDQADRQVLDDAAAGPEFELVPVWSRQNHRIDRDDSVVPHPSLTVAGIVLGRALAPGVEVLCGAAEVQNHYGDLVCRSPCLVRR